MNEGNITVVDVIATDDGYQLSRPAQDLYIAYEVVRRHIDSDGVRHYAQMSSARITDDGYEFKFETGDVFTCASHEDRPASVTVSDVQVVAPLVYRAAAFTTDTQLKKSDGTTNTTEYDYIKIKSALSKGIPVVVLVGDAGVPCTVTALYPNAVSLLGGSDFYVVVSGGGSKGTTLVRFKTHHVNEGDM